MASLYRHLLLEGKLISNDLSTVIRVLHSLLKVFSSIIYCGCSYLVSCLSMNPCRSAG